MVATLFAFPARADQQRLTVACGETATKAANRLERAQSAYAAGDFTSGVSLYKEAALLYNQCAASPRAGDAKWEARLAALDALLKAAEHAPDAGAIYGSISKAAGDAMNDPSINNKTFDRLAALKNQADAKTGNIPASTVGIDPNCVAAYAAFSNAYQAWYGAYARYFKSIDDTNAVFPKYVLGPTSYFGAALDAGYELRAIRSTIDAEEPRLQQAWGAMQATSAGRTGQIVADMLAAIQAVDAGALAWTTSRLQSFQSLAAGGPAYAIDESASTRSRDARARVSADAAQLTQMKICGG